MKLALVLLAWASLIPVAWIYYWWWKPGYYKGVVDGFLARKRDESDESWYRGGYSDGYHGRWLLIFLAGFAAFCASYVWAIQ